MVNKGLTCSKCKQRGHVIKDCLNGKPKQSAVAVPHVQATASPGPKNSISPQAVQVNVAYICIGLLKADEKNQQQLNVLDVTDPHLEMTFGIGSIKAGFIEPGGTAIFRRGSYIFQNGAFAGGAIGSRGTLIFEGGKYTFKSGSLALGALGPGSTLYFSSDNIVFCHGAFGPHDFKKSNCNLIFDERSRSALLQAFRNEELPDAASIFFPSRDSNFPVDYFPSLKHRLDREQAPSQGRKRKAESPQSSRTKPSPREVAQEMQVARLDQIPLGGFQGAPLLDTRQDVTDGAHEGSTSSMMHPSRVAMLAMAANDHQPQTVTLAAGKAGKENNRTGFNSISAIRKPLLSFAELYPSAYFSASSAGRAWKSTLPKLDIGAALALARQSSPSGDLPSTSTVRSVNEELEPGEISERKSNGPISEDTSLPSVKKVQSHDG
ncbi:MAG: hypothetical protein M1835_007002 [Candelina submexicana]|nr:MAG: hypothetical protein M1835_007002 [Candelina submexicana]